MSYTHQQISESFFAVQSFLQLKQYSTRNSNTLKCEFFFKNPNHSYQHTLETESKEFIENLSFVLHSDAFKTEGYYQPVWSAYHMFSWDETIEELSVELNNKEFIIKHI
ncbi:hypothetical protein [Gillisia sp. JM1]|uniref:hypothetical protein n=1 Tax=Gillisia sp. JM1 TaxID=1283286 RepID=UPI0004162588|nr:hypothetical protein [Gillisia sp. JM1]